MIVWSTDFGRDSNQYGTYGRSSLLLVYRHWDGSWRVRASQGSESYGPYPDKNTARVAAEIIVAGFTS